MLEQVAAHYADDKSYVVLVARSVWQSTQIVPVVQPVRGTSATEIVLH